MSIRHFIPVALFVSASFSALACAAEEQEEELFDETRCTDEGVSCSAYGRKDYANKPPAYELGSSTKPARLTVVHQSKAGWEPTDIEFNPRSPRDLWISNYATGHMTIVRNVGTTRVQVVERRDPAYGHFMNSPPAFAMAGTSQSWGQLWATCGDNDNGGNYFMGPTLYSAELNIFGGENRQTGLGSHLDMLHSTSYCRGIAWAGQGNQYFVFNANNKSIDFYDFVKDHGPGWDDHADGRIRRYWNNQVSGVDGVVSHVAWNNDEKKLYVADTGNKRILVLDPAVGRPTAPMQGMEPIVERSYYESPVKVLVGGGVLAAPAGIEASGGLVFVTDAATSQIHAFKVGTGELVRSLDTKLPPGSLAGLNFGPDGKIYFVDRLASRVYRLDP
ncbi:MAG TPA: hypothetical protein VM925_37400 [Labilithrix sp.]|nr:hypothetical protein [Labilithrix sp.]